MATLLKCDNVFCGKGFELKKGMIRTISVRDDIEKTYFICPHCGREYVTHYTDSKIKELIGEIKEINQKIESGIGGRESLIKKKKKMIKKALNLSRELEINININIEGKDK